MHALFTCCAMRTSPAISVSSSKLEPWTSHEGSRIGEHTESLGEQHVLGHCLTLCVTNARLSQVPSLGSAIGLIPGGE